MTYSELKDYYTSLFPNGWVIQIMTKEERNQLINLIDLNTAKDDQDQVNLGMLSLTIRDYPYSCRLSDIKCGNYQGSINVANTHYYVKCGAKVIPFMDFYKTFYKSRVDTDNLIDSLRHGDILVNRNNQAIIYHNVGKPALIGLQREYKPSILAYNSDLTHIQVKPLDIMKIFRCDGEPCDLTTLDHLIWERNERVRVSYDEMLNIVSTAKNVSKDLIEIDYERD